MSQEQDRASGSGKTGPRKAAALGFDPELDGAPRVLAAGKGAMAEEIIALAKAHGKRVIEDPALSKLLDSVPVGKEIPENLHRAVAAVFALVYRLEDRAAS